MFTYQTISRNDLRSPASSARSSPDPEFTERIRSRVRNQYTFTAPEAEEELNIANESDDEETELVLFAGAPGSSGPQTHKIRLHSPDAVTGDGGFIVKRPRSYYFTDSEDPEIQAQFKAAAIDARTILSMAREPWPACAVPWKVKRISPAGIKRCVLVGHPKMVVDVEEKVDKRKRKGKKARIALRKEMRAKEAKKVEDEQKRIEKEEADREKKTRRNREKKLKKKAREKAKKLGAKEEGGDADVDNNAEELKSDDSDAMEE